AVMRSVYIKNNFEIIMKSTDGTRDRVQALPPWYACATLVVCWNRTNSLARSIRVGGRTMSARSGSRRGLGIACLAAFLAVCGPRRADAARVGGKVVDREGKPAAGAIVWIAKLGYLEPLESRETTADGSGAFDIEVGDGSWALFARKGLEGGRVGWESLAEIK